VLHHVVLLTLNDQATDQAVEAVLDGLQRLPAAIPELRSMACGRDAGLGGGAADLVLVATFDSVADFEAYRVHPAHVALGRDRLRPILASAATAQFEAPAP
jgi:hypothetical protein